VVVLLTLLGGRLVQLQTFDSKAYAAAADKQREVNSILPAMRGSIFDRSGQPLAMSVDARLISADPYEVNAGVSQPKSTWTVAAIAAALAPKLGLTAADLTGKLTKTTTGKDGKAKPASYVVLAHGISPSAAAQIAALKLPGIASAQEQKRLYPGGTLAANLEGKAGPTANGLTGLTGMEYAYNKMLAGVNGKQQVQVGVGGTPIPVAGSSTVPAVQGSSMTLTIDRDIQWKAQQAIAEAVTKTAATSGVAIVMNPKTGAILAMAVAPTFDPSKPSNASAAAMGNAALSEIYEPGSVNKVITAAAAIQEGLVKPDTEITVEPTYPVAGHTFHDAERHGTEHLTVTGVLAQSSNIGAIHIAQKLGQQKLYDYLTKFGLGKLSGLNLPGEDKGLLPTVDKWSGTSLPTIAFGQGISVNALQVASVYSTIANGGVRMTPQLVASTTAPNGVVTPTPTAKGVQVVSATVAHQVSNMLESVTTGEGTAPEAQIPGYRVAGKTGTAQKADGKGGYTGYTASFVGYAPADKPQLVVEVVLQDPQNGHYGGSVAAPVFQQVMSFALAHEGIAPTGTKPPTAKLSFD
jgi:cell division protein FtsI (penicillin-binding protein 3)